MKKEKMKIRNNKKAQITIFIIIALIIVTVIALIFMFFKGEDLTIRPEKPDSIVQSIEKCANDAAVEAIDKLIPHGGFIAPRDYITYNNTQVVWLCHTPDEDKLCLNKHPALKTEIEKEIYNYVKPKIDRCFLDVKNQFQRYDYRESGVQLKVELVPGRVYIKMNNSISYNYKGSAMSLSNFGTMLNSALYNLVIMSTEIVNEEVSCECNIETCNADIVKLNENYRDFQTVRFVTGKNEKIYTITEKLTGKQFNFAVRNCVRMP